MVPLDLEGPFEFFRSDNFVISLGYTYWQNVFFCCSILVGMSVDPERACSGVNALLFE